MTRAQLVVALRQAETKSARLCAARAALPPGSTRAKVTTANARWARAAEERDRIRRELDAIDMEGGR